MFFVLTLPLNPLLIDSSMVFSALDWNQLVKICLVKECLKIGEVAKFESYLLKTNKE